MRDDVTPGGRCNSYASRLGDRMSLDLAGKYFDTDFYYSPGTIQLERRIAYAVAIMGGTAWCAFFRNRY